MNQCGCFIPVHQDRFTNCSIKIPASKAFGGEPQGRYRAGSVYAPYCLPFGDETKTAELFVEALTHSQQEDAQLYISKNYVSAFDWNELTDFFHSVKHYTNLLKVEFDHRPKNCKTNSILVMNQEKGGQSIIHLHMIHEPDTVSQWKIYSIEKE